MLRDRKVAEFNRAAAAYVSPEYPLLMESALSRLSAQERRVLDLSRSDLSNDEICAEMNIKPSTLRVFRSRIRKKILAPV